MSSSYPNFLPQVTEGLTELTSIDLLKNLQQIQLMSSVSPQPVHTTYTRQGKGNIPLLLLHGFDSSVLEFRRLIPLLSQNHEVWSVDLLGFGFTSRSLDIAVSPHNIKTHLYDFCQHLIGKPVILVGASMGGAAALDFTLTYPRIVEKLVLIDSAGLANPPILGKFMFSPLDTFATSFLANPRIRQNISRTAYYDKSLASLDAGVCAALHLECENWSRSLISFTKSGGYGAFLPKLSRIGQETLIIWGENDRILGVKDATRFKNAISRSKLVWIPRCGHVPHLEKPVDTARAIEEFI
ncbi:MAG: 2-hydroxy-6-oxo-6-(2'-aminophenyl)hexa-2,4-dienoic acid hydrolase [Chroococcopsis gigantea SAG 12.99]|jgi:pimeloyl-ACP methyl ester carboxylesterase|nr:alpha/beta hydrolase [Chlorogloea purpurea SAG 13.99]MDV2999598.1 2-hydroxy-6-oxo-6-(2'-aminophenyl)hexa-2,4-dienoic acid hydrolase [Chroococcopsis gigantea SAG 12.99]